LILHSYTTSFYLCRQPLRQALLRLLCIYLMSNAGCGEHYKTE